MKSILSFSVVICTVLTAAGAASAADLPAREPVLKAPPPVAIYNWTGFYIGGHAGWAWTDKTWRDVAGNALVDYTADGGIAGGQLGFNWQSGNWVLGAEAQLSWAHLRKGVPYVEQDNLRAFTDQNGRVNTVRIGTTVENLGTVAGRVGYAFDRVLVFAKGGAAWTHDRYRAFNANTATETLISSASGTRWGWMAGGGIEYGFAGNWSAKVEFDYLDFGSERISLVSVPGVTPATRAFNVEQTIALVKVGINYRFGAPTR